MGWQLRTCAGCRSRAERRPSPTRRMLWASVGPGGVGLPAVGCWRSLLAGTQAGQAALWAGWKRLEGATEEVVSKQVGEAATPEFTPVRPLPVFSKELTLQRGVEGGMNVFFKWEILLAEETGWHFFCDSFFSFSPFLFSSHSFSQGAAEWGSWPILSVYGTVRVLISLRINSSDEQVNVWLWLQHYFFFNEEAGLFNLLLQSSILQSYIRAVAETIHWMSQSAKEGNYILNFHYTIKRVMYNLDLHDKKTNFRCS